MKVDAIVGMLYEGAVSKVHWQGALENLCATVGAAMFHSCRVRRSDGAVLESHASDGWSGAIVRDYEQQHMAHDIRVPLIAAPPACGVFVDHEHFDGRSMSRSPIYADWLHGIGLKHTLGMQADPGPGEQHLFGFMRERTAPAFDARSRQLCERLAPHLARAARLRARVSRLAGEAALAWSVLDQLARALMVVRADGHIVRANAAAAAQLDAGAVCQLVQGRVRLALPAQQRQLERALAAATVGTPASADVLRLSEGQGAAWITLSVLPLAPGHPLADAASGERQALLLLSGADDDLPADPGTLERLLGLTPTEARLALELARGGTLRSFALAQGCTEATARAHLRNLMGKCGCSRQAQVVRLVQSLRRV